VKTTKLPFMLLFTLILFSIMPVLSEPNLAVEWVWDEGLYQGYSSYATIKITNNMVENIHINNILIHHSWMGPNIFSILRCNITINPSETYNQQIEIAVPDNAQVGESGDFACVFDYTTPNGTKISSGITRPLKTRINAGKSVYLPQFISIDSITIICITFLALLPLMWYYREFVLQKLTSNQKQLSHILFFVIAVIYTSALFMNYAPWLKADPYRGFYLTGDEPHYIVATSAFLRGDMSPDSIYEPNQYRHTKISGGLLNNGTEIFKHPIGLPVLLAIPYFLGEHLLYSSTAGVLIFMCLLMAGTVSIIYKLSLYLSKGNMLASLLTAGAFALSTLLFVWSGQVFSEPVLAFFIILGMYKIYTAESRSDYLIAGFSFGVLPFFKYQAMYLTVLSIIILLITSIKNKKQLYSVIALIFPFTLFYIHTYLYVGFNSIVMLGAYIGDVGVKTIPLFGYNVNKEFILSAVGLFLDYNCGILFYGPILILALLGVTRLISLRETGTYLTIAFIIFWVGAISASTYWNGWLAPPGRYLLPILPLISVPFILGAVRFFKTRPYILSYTALFLLGLISNMLISTNRLLGYTMTSVNGVGMNRFIEALSRFGLNRWILPEFFDSLWLSNTTVLTNYATSFVVVVVVLLVLSEIDTILEVMGHRRHLS